MEACGDAYFWPRRLTQLGHTARMMAPNFVRSHLISNRTVHITVFVVTLGLVSADISTWNELDIATIYGLPLMLAGVTRSRRLLWVLTALLTITTFAVYFLQIPPDRFTLSDPFFLNRVLDVVALLLMAGLLHIWIRLVDASETHARLIKVQNEKLEAGNVSRRLVAVHESERRELANHLHDLVGLKLTVLSINLNILESQISPGQTTQIGMRLADSLQLVEETMESIRDVISELRPAVLDDHGLTPALRWFVDQFAKRTDVATSVIAQGPAHRLPPATEEAFFRIAQEALANVAKYARAQTAVVTLDSTPRSLRLTISDDGCGFVPTTDRPPDMNHGWGLRIMRERADTAGAQLSVESTPGLGTRVSVQWRDDAVG